MGHLRHTDNPKKNAAENQISMHLDLRASQVLVGEASRDECDDRDAAACQVAVPLRCSPAHLFCQNKSSAAHASAVSRTNQEHRASEEWVPISCWR